MVTVFDVAAYIIEKLGPMNPKKLHKLAYYAQGWSLAWTDLPLFPNRIEAWKDGPVVRDFYQKHRKSWSVVDIDGDASVIRGQQKETLDSILAFYGHRDANWLINRSHEEAPWIDARAGLQWWQPGDREITQSSMKVFFKSLL